MVKFMLLFRGGAVVNKTVSAADRKAQVTKWSEWMAALKASGNYFPGGAPLSSPGAVVRTGQRELSDGFPADAQLVTGTYLLEAASLAAATELAQCCPVLDLNGSVEVRPLLERPE